MSRARSTCAATASTSMRRSPAARCATARRSSKCPCRTRRAVSTTARSCRRRRLERPACDPPRAVLAPGARAAGAAARADAGVTRPNRIAAYRPHTPRSGTNHGRPRYRAHLAALRPRRPHAEARAPLRHRRPPRRAWRRSPPTSWRPARSRSTATHPSTIRRPPAAGAGSRTSGVRAQRRRRHGGCSCSPWSSKASPRARRRLPVWTSHGCAR